MKRVQALETPKRPQSKLSFNFNEKFRGYILSDNDKLLEVIVGSEEDLVRYLANERTHLYPEYDPIKHRLVYEQNVQDLDLGIPFKLYERNTNNLKLPDGLYVVDYDHEVGSFLKELTLYTDKYVNYRQNINEEIYNDLTDFLNNREKYTKERGRHRSSLLLYGPPGNGKTREICRILECAKEKEFIAIFIPGSYQYLDRIDSFKKVLEGRNVVFVLEEMTERTKDRSNIEELLSFLDGEMSYNNCFVIATTNYPDALPANIVDRPGRFTKVVEFGNPTEKEIEIFMKKKDYGPEEAQKYAKMLKGLSLDYICFIITESRIKEKSIEAVLKEAKALRDKVSMAFRKPINLGDD